MKRRTDQNTSASKKARLILSGTALIGTLAAVMLIGGIVQVIPSKKSIQLPTQPGYYTVTYVHDGDTISVQMDGREEKVRMIGIDTPETIKPNSPVECYGKKASDYTKSMLNNQSVRLESDPINQNRDRYDRLLRYVYLKDGTLYNKSLIEKGYGFAYLSFSFTKAEEFRQAQLEARKHNLGVWSGECDISDPEGDRPKTNQL